MTPRIQRVVARLLLIALCLFGAGTVARAAAEPVEIIRVEARQSPGRCDRCQSQRDERRAPRPASRWRPPPESRDPSRSSLEPPGRLALPGARFALFLRDRSFLI